MITHKKIAVKREIRTLKHSNESYEYKLDYAVTYKDGQIHSISKHERKYFDVSVQGGIEQRGGLYMNPINPLSKAFAKAKAFIEDQEVKQDWLKDLLKDKSHTDYGRPINDY